MKARFFNYLAGLVLFLTATPSILARSIPADTLPAGTKISVAVQLPGELQATRIEYTVPASLTTVKPDPQPEIPVVDNSTLTVRQSIGNQTATLNQPFTFVIPESTYNISPSTVDVSDLPPGLRYDSQTRTISGTPTQADTRTITVSATKNGKLVQTTFSLSVATLGAPVKPAPDRTDNPVNPPAPTAQAIRNTIPFTYSSKPNKIDRMQAPAIPPYLDGWRMKSSDIVVGGNDGTVETPDELRKRGHSDFNALWFYGDEGMPSWGYPKSTDNLFFEYTGNHWAPWHKSPFQSIVDDFSTIANTSLARLPNWNTSAGNGLIDGVSTVKLGHFNVEYDWFEKIDWDRLNQNQRNTPYFNYATNRRETLQDTYNRGGIQAIQDAQHQKWRNIIAVSILYLDRNSNGMKAFYGDYHGLSSIKSLANWNLPVNPTEYLTADVNNGALFPEANQTVNAGPITLWNGQTFDVSGNFNLINKHRHCYSYEWEFFMKRADYETYFSITKNAPAEEKDIRKWYDKFYPNLTRPYDIVYHALANWSIEQRKGWPHMPLEWQSEPIFEQLIRDKDTYAELNGAWVPWTLHDLDNQKQTKVPLHPEISEYLTIYARMHYDGKFMWGLGCCSRINPETGKGDNVNPTVHQVAREAEQLALTELGQYNTTVFTPDKRQHIGDVPIYNPATNQYVTGNPDQLLKAQGGPMSLVTAVDSPTTGWELYTVYFPHSERNQRTTVRWKSPVDGAELSGEAEGWKVRLYARKR